MAMSIVGLEIIFIIWALVITVELQNIRKQLRRIADKLEAARVREEQG